MNGTVEITLACGVAAMIAAYRPQYWWLGIGAGAVLLFVLTRTPI